MPDGHRTPETDRRPSGGGAAAGWRRLRPLAAYGGVLALTLALLPLVLPLGRLDLRTPFSYGGDSFLILTLTKSLVEGGSTWRNPSLGAPGGMELYEYPVVDTFSALLLKALMVCTHDPALLDNLYLLLTYPLASLAAFAVCRQFGVSAGPSALAGLLYAFLPYHQFRGEAHLYLSAYFVVPPAVLAAWWVADGRLLAPPAGRGGRWRLPAAAVLCVLVSTAGVYYPFFAGLLLAAASLLALARRRDWRHALAGAGLAALLAAGLLACLFPALRYMHGHPGSPAGARQRWEAEVYGLKVIQLILPVDGHRLRPFRKIRSLYDQDTPLVNENSSAALGTVGAAGFLLLVGWLLFRPRTPAAVDGAGADPSPYAFLDIFSVFNAVALLYGTIGGGGSLFALLVSPQLRGLNRVSVYIAFCALAAVAVCLDATLRRWRVSARWHAAGCAGLAGLLLAGVLDQTTPADPAAHRAIAQVNRDDQDFFDQTAAATPAGGEIFELPAMSFPENGSVEGLGDYALFDGYVHTHGLRWSYGAMRGGAADQWQQEAGGLPPAGCVRRLALCGFDGVLLERAGYADHGAAWAEGLGALLGPPAVSAPDRLFFRLADYSRALRATMTSAQWERAADLALHRVYFHFETGFAAPIRQPPPRLPLRWCAATGELRLVNPGRETRRVDLRMLASSVHAEPASLTLCGAATRQTWTLTRQPQASAVRLDLPPGEHLFRFTYGNPGQTPRHPREPAWCLADFQLEPTDDAPAPAASLNPPTPAAAAAPPGAP